MPKNQNTRYPLVVVLLSLAGLTALFFGGIPVQAPLEQAPKPPDNTAEKPVPTTPDSKASKAGTAPQLRWRLVHIPKPNIEGLHICLSAQAFSELKIFGQNQRFILVERSVKGTAELKQVEPNQWQLTTPTDKNYVAASRLHVATTGCLYTDKAHVSDPLLNRSLAGGNWPRLSEKGGMFIGDLISFERDGRHVVSKGLSRMGTPELEMVVTTTQEKAKETLQRIVSTLFNSGFEAKSHEISGIGSVTLSTHTPGQRRLVTVVASPSVVTSPKPTPENKVEQERSSKQSRSARARPAKKAINRKRSLRKGDERRRQMPQVVPTAKKTSTAERNTSRKRAQGTFMPEYRDD